MTIARGGMYTLYCTFRLRSETSDRIRHETRLQRGCNYQLGFANPSYGEDELQFLPDVLREFD